MGRARGRPAGPAELQQPQPGADFTLCACFWEAMHCVGPGVPAENLALAGGATGAVVPRGGRWGCARSIRKFPGQGLNLCHSQGSSKTGFIFLNLVPGLEPVTLFGEVVVVFGVFGAGSSRARLPPPGTHGGREGPCGGGGATDPTQLCCRARAQEVCSPSGVCSRGCF